MLTSTKSCFSIFFKSNGLKNKKRKLEKRFRKKMSKMKKIAVSVLLSTG
jgi:hypothetical protein